MVALAAAGSGIAYELGNNSSGQLISFSQHKLSFRFVTTLIPQSCVDFLCDLLIQITVSVFGL